MAISINDLRRSFFGNDEHTALQAFYDAGVNAADLVGIAGIVQLTDGALPTADPGVAGQLWNDAGTVKVSAGV